MAVLKNSLSTRSLLLVSIRKGNMTVEVSRRGKEINVRNYGKTYAVDDLRERSVSSLFTHVDIPSALLQRTLADDLKMVKKPGK